MWRMPGGNIYRVPISLCPFFILDPDSTISWPQWAENCTTVLAPGRRVFDRGQEFMRCY